MGKGLAFLALTAALSTPAMAKTELRIPAQELRIAASDDAIKEALVKRFEQQILDSTVCIRGVGYYDIADFDPITGTPITTARQVVYHGTGGALRSVTVNGKTEYLIVTNNHVSKPEDVNQHVFFENDKQRTVNWTTESLQRYRMRIVDNAWDNDERDDIELEVVARDPDSDAALMRTVNTSRALKTFEPEFDFEGKVRVGEKIFSVGFPHGRSKTLQTGTITNTEYLDWTLTPYFARVITADIRIDGGQSGSPTYTVDYRLEGDQIVASLKSPGLIYGANAEDDTTRMITPAKHFKKLLETMEDVQTRRPKLDAPVTSLDEVVRPGDNSFIFKGRQRVVTVEGSTVNIKEYVVKNNVPIRSQYLETTLQMNNGVAVQEIAYNRGENRKVLRRADLSSEESARYDLMYTSMLNHFKQMRHLEALHSKLNSDVNATQEQAYYNRLINENTEDLHKRWLSVHRDLAAKKIIHDNFW